MSTAVLEPTLDPADELVAAARARAERSFNRRELSVESAATALLLAVAVAMAVSLPTDGMPSGLVAGLLVVAYAITRHVSFEVGTGYASPLVLVLVPMLFLLPPAVVPLHVAAALILAELGDALRGGRLSARTLLAPGQAWHAVPPALVFALAGVEDPDPARWPVFLAALGAMFVGDGLATLLIERLRLGVSPAAILRPALWIDAVDAMLAPVGFLAAYLAVEHPAGALLVMPLVGLLAVFASERSRRLDHALELSAAYRGTAMLLGSVIESDHEYTGSHSRDVVALAVAVGDRLGLSRVQLRDLEFAALLHDVGKIAVPNDILNKPGPLDDAEWAIMKRHTIEGERMLASVGGVLARVGTIVRGSHEAYNGSGYPDGLAGEAIPIEARVCTACDAFSAMTTDRPYRTAMSEEEALAELRRCSGTQFDPSVVAAVASIVNGD